MAIGEFVKSADFKNEKHVPVIELPEKIEAGKEFVVNVSVGKEIAHPNTTEHFIGWIALYFKPENGNVYNLGRAEFTAHGESTEGANKGPAFTEPSALFKVKLNQPGKLVAVSYCNIHGLWESEVEVKF
ncbi:superoxide reductase [Deferribacter desulfuricans SSM1]|uniref:Superoxide reductase n=1 Tax=Deferribacter desulfuricans (strain DSM 14783 / JCM 11476 / NBRC 101012 / SSM1) TaxID=639282 RepID=D3PD16_DEFDS|nr:class II SORL domain-containing protein [Deferribacter desulfuricans]BAI80489.1 superoxide reductase [Deferribacter desulfuricans SSM1]